MSGLRRFAIIGLGNPDAGLEMSRHNIGFHVVNALATRLDGSWKRGSSSMYRSCKITITAENQTLDITLVKPQTFMNLSGSCLKYIIEHEHFEPLNEILVVCDDVNLQIGKMKIKKQGSHGGHNGLRDISQQLGNSEYPRLRIGVGGMLTKPHPLTTIQGLQGESDLIEYVLSEMTKEELRMRPFACQAILDWMQTSDDKEQQKIMTKWNGFDGNK